MPTFHIKDGKIIVDGTNITVTGTLKDEPIKRRKAINVGGRRYWMKGYPFLDLMKTGTRWGENEIIVGNKGWFPGGRYHTDADSLTRSMHVSDNVWETPDYLEGNMRLRNGTYLLPQDYHKNDYHPDFLDDLGSVDVIRFMQWMKTNNSEVIDYEDYTDESELVWKRVPINWIAYLCSIKNAEPWICLPHAATNTCIKNILLQLDHYLIGSIKNIWVGWSNEPWNWAPPYRKQFDYVKYELDPVNRSDLDRDVKNLDNSHFKEAKKCIEVWNLCQETLPGRNIIKVCNGWWDRGGDAGPWRTKLMRYVKGYEPDVLSFGLYWGVRDNTEWQTKGITDEYKQKWEEDTRVKLAKHKEWTDIPIVCYESGNHHGKFNEEEAYDWHEMLDSDGYDIYKWYYGFLTQLGIMPNNYASHGLPYDTGSHFYLSSHRGDRDNGLWRAYNEIT